VDGTTSLVTRGKPASSNPFSSVEETR